LAILDDLIKDDDARSRTTMNLIKDTVYKGVNHALDPTRRKIIFNGTPFHKEDIMVEAVESGAWEVNVWPVCEKFPCEPHEFKGAWPERFSYEYIAAQYDMAKAAGRQGAFYQELMLRLSDSEERLVADEDIVWYDRESVMGQRARFNFYITTDFATSEKQSADFSVMSVWAYGKEGVWFWVDGLCERQTMDKNIDALFSFALKYRPQSVGIEVSGQQGGFITWIAKEMRQRDVWFSFASNQNGRQAGIRPATDKLSRFHLVVPLFKAGKIQFPRQMQKHAVMREFMDEIRLAAFDGLKGHDDCLDTISMLPYMRAFAPEVQNLASHEQAMTGPWVPDAPREDDNNRYGAYIV